MRLKISSLFMLGIGLSGYGICDTGICRYSSRIILPNSFWAPAVVGQVAISYEELPIVNCESYSRFPSLIGFSRRILSQIQSVFGNFSKSRILLSQWLNSFHPDNLYAQQVLDALKSQIAVGLQCQKLFHIMPPTLRDYLNHYFHKTQQSEARKYIGISNRCPEVFLFHHGLRMLDPRIREPLKKKSFLDIGAFTGDSALVLSQYAKDVYSIELSAANYAVMNRILAQNPNLSANVRSFHIGVSDRESETSLIGSGEASRISSGAGEHIKLITIDAFVKMYNLTIGFIKADVEGHVLAVVKGAVGTLIRDRPIFSFASYHDFSEMYNVSKLLMDSLSNYYFEWHMENPATSTFFELSLFGRPKEAREM